MCNTVATVCPKCLGAKGFQVFNHIAAGVCFTCNGSGVIDVPETEWKQKQEKNEAVAKDNAEKRAWLISATEKAIEKLSFSQLVKARDFASACLHYEDRELLRAHRMLMKQIEKVAG